MSDKTEVNLSGVKQSKNVWLVKVRLEAEPWLFIGWHLGLELVSLVRHRGNKRDSRGRSGWLYELVSHQVPKYLSQQWEKTAEKGDVGKISIAKQVQVKRVHAVFFGNMLFMRLMFWNMKSIWQETRQNGGESGTAVDCTFTSCYFLSHHLLEACRVLHTFVIFGLTFPLKLNLEWRLKGSSTHYFLIYVSGWCCGGEF